MDVGLTEWLGRFDAEGFEQEFRARGMTSVQAVVDAHLTDTELKAMGVVPLWKRTSILSGVAEQIKEMASNTGTGWADFDEVGAVATAAAHSGSAMGSSSASPATGNLLGMLGEGDWTAKEDQRSFTLQFGVVEKPAGAGGPHSRVTSGPDLLFCDDDEAITDAKPNYRVVATDGAVVQAGFPLNSAVVGNLSTGQVFAPLEHRTNEQGMVRVRCTAGWVTRRFTAPAGDWITVLQATESPAPEQDKLTLHPATTLAAAQPKPESSSIEVTAADKHAAAVLSSIDQLLGALSSDEEDENEFSFTAQTGIKGASPPTARSMASGREPRSRAVVADNPNASSAARHRIREGEVNEHGEPLTRGGQLTEAGRRALGSGGRFLDEHLAISETGRLVAESARSKKEILADLDQRYHFTEKGKSAASKTVAAGKVGVAQSREALTRLAHSKLAELSKAQLRALRDKLRDLESKRRAGEVSEEHDSRSARLAELDSMFETSPSTAARMTEQGLGKTAVTKNTIAPSEGYDYGDYGGVTLEDCMRGVEALTEPGPSRTEVELGGYDYGNFEGVTLEECLAGVQAVTETDDMESVARRSVRPIGAAPTSDCGTDEGENDSTLQLVAQVEARVRAEQQHNSAAERVRVGPAAPSSIHKQNTGKDVQEMEAWLANFGAEDCLQQMLRAGYASPLALAQANLQEEQLVKLGVSKASSQRAMISALKATLKASQNSPPAIRVEPATDTSDDFFADFSSQKQRQSVTAAPQASSSSHASEQKELLNLLDWS